MDELHLLSAVRYVEMNPVAAGIVSTPAQYRWSSAQAHLVGKNDNLTDVLPLLDIISNWKDFLRLSTTEELKVQKLHERTGRPLGSDRFLEKMEVTLGRVLRPQKPGPKKKNKS